MANVDRLNGELQQEIRKLQEQMLPKIPQEIISKFLSTTEDLVRSGIAEKGLKEGAKAPDFVLKNQRGGTVSLTERLSQGSVILTFYRGGW